MYTILRVYADLGSITEKGDNIANVFGACAIYVEDPDLLILKVWDEAGTFIVDYYKDA